ncbi:MAG TPA: lipid II flippase MurJ, partial [Gaiellaceae bacterium]|nr:lipid II flippase MurJ [Gaiellaceae bacterium]
LFPALSRFAARRDTAGFSRTVSLGLRQIGFMLLPASVISALLAEPIVRLLYERGAFDARETEVVAASLAAFSVGLAFNGTMLMLNRAFFSLQLPWIATAVALANLALNVALNAALYRVGIWGIPLATSLVNLAGTAALLWIFRRRVGPLGGAGIIDAYVRVAIASAVAGGAAFVVWWALDAALGRSLGAQVVSVGLALAASVGVYLLAARVLRVRELETLLGLLRRSGRTRPA